MELSKIEKLLLRYEEGETSLAEEQQLRHYFLNENVPEHLRNYQLLFNYTTEENKRQFNGDSTLPGSSKNYRFAWTSIAAVIIVALGMFYFNEPTLMMNKNDLGTISDQEIALQKTKETLNSS